MTGVSGSYGSSWKAKADSKRITHTVWKDVLLKEASSHLS